ncbi:Gpi1-domain-containing protein, partial [Piromyces finnis]
MNKFGAISKILWPEHLCKGKSGFLVGWNLRSFISSVATIVPDMTLEELELELNKMSKDNDMKDIATPIVLGVCISHEDSPEVLRKFTNTIGISQKKQTANLWLTVEYLDNILPQIQSIYCCGYCYQGVSSEIILYKQLNIEKMQYYSLDPIIIDFKNQRKIWSEDDKLDLDEMDSKNKDYLKKIKKKISIHAQYNGTDKPDDMELLLTQVNSSYLIEKKLNEIKEKKNYKNNGTNMIFSSLNNILSTLSHILKRYLLLPLLFIVITLFFFLKFILKILNKGLSIISPEMKNLKKISVTIQQVELRLYQYYNSKWQHQKIHKSNSKMLNRKKQTQYLSFYNSIAVILQDGFFGIIIGALLIKYNKQIAYTVNKFFWNYTIKFLREAVDWLMDTPAGLKLNKELDKFLGDLFLWLIQIWSIVLSKIFSYTDEIVLFIGIAGILGASISLSLTSDLIALATFHLHIFYKVASKIYYWQFSILLSLFNLLRGKRRNTLRNRLDSFEYNLDQLLLGTIIFTLLFFLYPTTGVYYILFSLSRLAVISIQIIFDLLLAFINHFPLFPLIIRICFRERLPGGLMFHIVLSEDLLKSGVNLKKGSVLNVKDSNQSTENKMNEKRNTNLNTMDIINKDKVFYFLNTNETISSASSSTESISSSDDTSSIKDSTIDDPKKRTNRLLPINDYNIQNYYNIQNRRYSYDMSYSTPRSNSFAFKNKKSNGSQGQLQPLSLINDNKNVDGQDNGLLSPYSAHFYEYHDDDDGEQVPRIRRYSSQSENNSFDNDRTIIKNTKCNTFPNLIIDSAEESEGDDESNIHNYSGHKNGNRSFGDHPSRLLLSPYDQKSLGKRRALTMPDLTFGHGRNTNHNLIRVNSISLTDNNIKPVHSLSKTTYLVMENTSISFGGIFHQLNKEVLSILGQYISVNLIKNLLVGKPISRIQVIQPFILSEDRKLSLNKVKKTINEILNKNMKNNTLEKKKQQ